MTVKTTMTIAILPELRERLDAIREDLGISRSAVVTRLLERALDSSTPQRSEGEIRMSQQLREIASELKRIAGGKG